MLWWSLSWLQRWFCTYNDTYLSPFLYDIISIFEKWSLPVLRVERRFHFLKIQMIPYDTGNTRSFWGLAEHACRDGRDYWQNGEVQYITLVHNTSRLLHLDNNALYYFLNLGRLSLPLHPEIWLRSASNAPRVCFTSVLHGCKEYCALTKTCFHSIMWHKFSKNERSTFYKTLKLLS